MSLEISRVYVTVGAETGELKTGMAGAKQEVAGFLDTMKQGMSLAAGFKVFEVAFEGIKAVAGALKGSVIDFNQTIDSAKISLSRFVQEADGSLGAFMADLKQFAALTPFEFKDLATLAPRLAAAKVPVQEIIPTIQAIGNAAAASGKLSQENMGRITTAITQMLGKGKVQAEEMNQLIEGGMADAWTVLAKALGVSEAAARKMVTEGKVAGTTMWEAMKQAYEGAGLMEKASKTIAGAMSTIKDVTEQTLADAFRPLYEDLTKLTVAVADFLQTKEFQAWTQAFKVGMGSALESLKGFLAGLAPIGEAIKTAFMQATNGDFSGAFATLTGGIVSAFTETVKAAQQFGSDMFGSGWKLVEEYARGITEGGAAVIQGAVDAVANAIASFLVGNSPPPEGPLSTIDDAGKRLMETYGEGMKGGLGPAKAAISDLDGKIREITNTVRDIDMEQSGLKRTVEDLKRGYEDQLRPLEAQLRLIEEKRNEGEKEIGLQFKLQEIELRRAEVAAKGDPIRRAEIQRQIELVKAQQQSLGLEDNINSIKRERAKLDDDGKRARLEEMQFARQEQELQDRIKQAKKDHKDTDGLEGQLKELRLRRQIALDDDKQRAEDNKHKLKNLELREKELGLQRDLDGMVDKNKLAEIAKERELLAVRKEEHTIQQALNDMGADAMKAEVLAQVKAIKDEQTATLAPMLAQLDSLARQKEDLNQLKSQYQGVKSEIEANVRAIKEQEAAAKAAAKAAAGAGGPAAPTGPQSYQRKTDASLEKWAEDQGKMLAEKMSSGVKNWIDKNWFQIVAGSIGAVLGGAAFGPIGAGIGATLGVSLVNKLQDVLGGKLGAAIEYFTNRLKSAFETGGWLSVLGFLGESVLAAGGPLLDNLGTLAVQVLDWVGEASAKLAVKLLEWGTAFVEWVIPEIPNLLSKLGSLLAKTIEWLGAKAGDLLDALGRWGLAFVEWVAPKIFPMLNALGRLLLAVLNWVVRDGLPALVTKLGEWGRAIVDWVGPRIPLVLAELAKLLLAVSIWMATTAVPAILKGAVEIGGALLSGIWDGIQAAWKWLEPYLGQATDWIIKTVKKLFGIQSPSTVFAEIGTALLEGLRDGMAKYWTDTLEGWFGGFKNLVFKAIGWIGTGASGALEWLEDLKSIGKAVLEGLKVGLEEFWKGGSTDGLEKWFQGLKNLIFGAIGWNGEGGLAWVEDLKNIGRGVLDGVLGGMNSFWAETLSPWFNNFKKAIFGALGLDANNPFEVKWLFESGRGLIDAFWDGLKTVWGNESEEGTAANWFQKIIDWIPKFIRDRLEHRSPSHVMFALGENTMLGFLNGVKKIFPDAQSTMKEFIGLFSGVDVDDSDWAKLARDAARRNGFPFPEVFMRQMRHESANWNSDVIWGQGRYASRGEDEARGIAQILSRYHPNVNVYDPFDSLDYAARLMNSHMGEYDDLVKALVAYNGGGGAVGHWERGDPYEESLKYIQAILGGDGIPGIPEMAEGGIVRARRGGTLLRAGEAGQDEAIVPLPAGWKSQQAKDVMHVPVIIGGRVVEDLWIEGRELALRRGRA